MMSRSFSVYEAGSITFADTAAAAAAAAAPMPPIIPRPGTPPLAAAAPAAAAVADSALESGRTLSAHAAEISSSFGGTAVAASFGGTAVEPKRGLGPGARTSWPGEQELLATQEGLRIMILVNSRSPPGSERRLRALGADRLEAGTACDAW